MSKMAIKFDYSKMRDLDIFMSTNNFPSSWVVRGVVDGWKNMFNKVIPIHTGFLTKDHGQFFATEMRLSGIDNESLEKYRKKNNCITSVWRWKGFDDKGNRDAAGGYLARLRRKQIEYDFGGLFGFTKVLRKVFPWIKNSKSKDFCSENVFRVLKRHGLTNWFKPWEKKPPSPSQLLNWFKQHSEEFSHVDCIEVIEIGKKSKNN